MSRLSHLSLNAARHVLVLCAAASILAACGANSDAPTPPVSTSPLPVTPPVTPPPPSPPVSSNEAFQTEADTSRFLGRATFGATSADISRLTGTDVSDWIQAEFAKPATPFLQPLVEAEPDRVLGEEIRILPNQFYDIAIAGDDQLRQRMVLALSEIIVASSDSGIRGRPLTMAHYVQVLSDNAFGNYRDLLEEITYSPAMAFYLTYMTNLKGDPVTGRVPDENYAREILQLFSIGLKELNPDGTDKLDADGQSIEIYDNSDIQGLAKVFTGMSTQGSDFHIIYQNFESSYAPLTFFPKYHSELEKKFLDVTIPAGTPGAESVEMALDGIFAHPNVGPFVSKQLIQRFVTSNPKPAYVGRVSSAFDTGRFSLPDGSNVGTGQRGDLKATLAAILLDEEALIDPALAPAEYGKIREPVMRLTNWARAFNETTPDASDEAIFSYLNYGGIEQSPFNSPSVFNFFRPGYVAPGTSTGDGGYVAPELQITNETTSIGYINFINQFIYDTSYNLSEDPDGGIKGDYTQALALANDGQALLDYLDLLLTGNRLGAEARMRILKMMDEIPVRAGFEEADKTARVRVAISMVMTAPGYLVQR
ncbi:MAG: DUF1800 family protein [Hellea sp.]